MNDTPCSRCGLRSKPIRRIDQPSPYAAYFNGIPLDQNPSATPSTRAEITSFILSLETELLDCDADIARVEDALRLLKQQREAGESLIAQHKGILSRLHSLPPEVMLEIFRHCLDENLYLLDGPCYSFNLGPGLPTPWILSAVCRRWRNILRQSPSFWSSFAAGQKLQLLADALELSRQAPLRFRLDLDSSGESCKRSLMKHSSRWEIIFISGARDAFITFGHVGQLPILKKLCISLEATWDAEAERFSDFDEIMDFTTTLSPFSDCPQLKELYITTEHGMWANQNALQTTSLTIPWSNLSKLTVALGPQSNHTIRSLLVACANLRQLDVQGFNDSAPNIDSASNEPLLIHSGITSLTLDNAFYLLEHIEFPTLTHLSLHASATHDFLPFLSRHCSSITHIEVSIYTYSAFNEEDWNSAAHTLSDVVQFTAHLYSMSIPSWNSLNILSKILGPKFRTLTIYPHRHLLEFCQYADILPLISSRWSVRKLQTLEIYSVRRMGVYFFTDNPVFSTLPKSDLPSVVSKMIEDSDMIKTLRGFKEEGLAVKINDIPLSDGSALLYM